jgi:hypothetical protein
VTTRRRVQRDVPAGSASTAREWVTRHRAAPSAFRSRARAGGDLCVARQAVEALAQTRPTQDALFGGAPPPAPSTVALVTASSDAAPQRKHRSLGQQLNRSPRVLHASWIMGLAVLAGLVTTGVGVRDLPGLTFLAVYFLPVFIAYRRDRLTFPIIFATIFLPTWPWAAYKALKRSDTATPGPGSTGWTPAPDRGQAGHQAAAPQPPST